MKPLRLALIGTWGHYPHVVEELAGCDAVTWVGCAKVLNDDSLDAATARFPSLASARRFDSAADMIAACSPDVAVVSTRPDHIASAAIEAATLGRCHLICEKPLAITHDDLRRLNATVKLTGVQCIAMLSNRWGPVLAAAVAAIRQGRIGRVILCNARKSYRFGQREPWYGDRRVYGGTIPWIGIHAMDFIDAAADSPIVSVAAMHGNAAHPAWPDCEDHCTLTMKLASGALATASVDFLRPAAAPTHGDDWLRIVGERGVIEAHMAAAAASIVTDKEPPAPLPLEPPQSYYRWAIERLQRDPASLAPETDRAFYLTHAALCARDAADEGRILAVPPRGWQHEHRNRRR